MVEMVEVIGKLEFMLMGLRQMNLSSVCAWFPQAKREDIIEAIRQSAKFKLEDGIVSLKSETEIYEEELQKDILKDLMGDENNIEDILEDDEFSSFGDDLELVEDVVIKEEIQEVQNIQEVELSEMEDVILQDIVELEPVEAQIEVVEMNNIESIQEPTSYSNNKFNEIVKESVKVKEVETPIEEVVQAPMNINKIDGSTLSYETILRLIGEYNEKVEGQLNYAVENRHKVREKAIKTFYGNKYNVRLKEESIIGTTTNIYGLVHKKKGMEVAYLVIGEILNDNILNYVLDNYDEEVVYFCPIDGVEVDFEVGLNEFYLKDTDIIFDKYLEHYVIVEEADKKIKKMEVIVGSH